MDKQTVSHYGWIMITTLVIIVIIAFVTPFGDFIGDTIVNISHGVQKRSDYATGEGYEQAKAEHEAYFAKLEKQKVVQAGLYEEGLKYDKLKYAWRNLTKEKVLKTERSDEGAYLAGTYYIGNPNPASDILVGDLVINAGVDVIAQNGFANCKKLKSVSFNSVALIGAKAFYNCSKLETLRITDSKLQTIESNAFSNTALKKILFNGTKAQWNNISIASNALPSRTITVDCNDGILTIS